MESSQDFIALPYSSSSKAKDKLQDICSWTGMCVMSFQCSVMYSCIVANYICTSHARPPTSGTRQWINGQMCSVLQFHCPHSEAGTGGYYKQNLQCTEYSRRTFSGRKLYLKGNCQNILSLIQSLPVSSTFLVTTGSKVKSWYIEKLKA